MDKSERPPLMAGARARVRALGEGEEEERRPNPIAGPPQSVSPLVVGALFVVGLGALYLLFSLMSAPPAEAPPALPTQAQAVPTVEAPAPAQNVEAPPAPTVEAAPTGESYLIGTEPAPPVQMAAPAVEAPAPVYAELVPLVEAPTAVPLDCAHRGIGACRGERP